MRLTVSAAEVPALVEAISAAVRLGRVTCTSQGWTVLLNVEDIPRSASWGTTLAVYFTLELAKQAMADLASRPGEVPDFELIVGAGETPPVLGKIARFFGTK